MSKRWLLSLIGLVAAGCGGPGDGDSDPTPIVLDAGAGAADAGGGGGAGDDVSDGVAEEGVSDGVSTDGAADDGTDADAGPVEKVRILLTGKDPGEASYEISAERGLEGDLLEHPDRIVDAKATGTIDEIRERDVYYALGGIDSIEVEGNIRVTVDGEVRYNGRKTLSEASPDDKPIVGLTIYSSVALLERNGRVGEQMVANYAANAFEEAGYGYEITYNFFPERPPDEKSNCSAGDAPQWWADRVRQLQIEKRAKDANIMMVDARGGGCGAVGGLYGTTPGRHIDELRAWKPVGTGDWHRNMHGTLHEIGHQLGARHDHDDEAEGQQHPGSAWNEEGPEGKTWWHRTPTTAGNGAPNRCGTPIEERQSQQNVKRHQTYAECFVQHFDVKSAEE